MKFWVRKLLTDQMFMPWGWISSPFRPTWSSGPDVFFLLCHHCWGYILDSQQYCAAVDIVRHRECGTNCFYNKENLNKTKTTSFLGSSRHTTALRPGGIRKSVLLWFSSAYLEWKVRACRKTWEWKTGSSLRQDHVFVGFKSRNSPGFSTVHTHQNHLVCLAEW